MCARFFCVGIGFQQRVFDDLSIERRNYSLQQFCEHDWVRTTTTDNILLPLQVNFSCNNCKEVGCFVPKSVLRNSCPSNCWRPHTFVSVGISVGVCRLCFYDTNSFPLAHLSPSTQFHEHEYDCDSDDFSCVCGSVPCIVAASVGAYLCPVMWENHKFIKGLIGQAVCSVCCVDICDSSIIERSPGFFNYKEAFSILIPALLLLKSQFRLWTCKYPKYLNFEKKICETALMSSQGSYKFFFLTIKGRFCELLQSWGVVF